MNQTPPTEQQRPTFGACAVVTLTPCDCDHPAPAQPHGHCCQQSNIFVATSRHRAACGDDLVAYCPSRWIGPRPAKVIDARFDASGAQAADVNVTLHGLRDADMLATVRRSASGNTLVDVPVYNALDEGARLELAASGVRTWAEFRPRAST